MGRKEFEDHEVGWHMGRSYGVCVYNNGQHPRFSKTIIEQLDCPTIVGCE